jgi:hypothetical protein
MAIGDILEEVERRDAGQLSTKLQQLIDTLCIDKHLAAELDVDTVRFEPKLEIRARCAWPSLVYTVHNVANWSNAFDSNIRTFQFRRFDDVGLMTTGMGDNEIDKSDDREILTSDECSLFMFLQSLFQLSAFISPRPFTPTEFANREFFYLQSIRLLGQETDDRFFLLPVAAGAPAIESSKLIWNRFVAEVTNKELIEDSFGEPAKVLVKLIVENWCVKEPEPGPLDSSSESFESLIRRAGKRYVKGPSDGQNLTRLNFSPGRAFQDWFEQALPRLFTELLVPRADLGPAIEAWLEALSFGGREKESADLVRRDLRLRIKRVMTPENRVGHEGLWMCGYLDFAERVDSQSFNNLMRQQSLYEAERSGDYLGRTPTQATVEFEETISQYTLEDEETSENLQLSTLLASTLSQLRK